MKMVIENEKTPVSLGGSWGGPVIDVVIANLWTWAFALENLGIELGCPVYEVVS